ncbi:MAG TPA: hypothetical protein VLM05_14835 [Mycobacteriales bacterium]|nr:hypothetical protein [Mycobacteriales bacterium]
MSQWAACGIAAAAARFVPVPLLDDAIRARAVRIAVSRALRAHGRDYPAGRLEPLWEDAGGGGIGRRVAALGRRVLLFPIRKYVAVFGAVRGVPNDVMRVVLLARTVDRRLAAGELATPDPDRARQIRHAVDAALEGMDLRLLTAALGDGLSQGRDLTAAAVRYARHFGDKDADPDLDPTGPVGAGAQRITEVLEQPEVAQLLARFDTEVDAALAR